MLGEDKAQLSQAPFPIALGPVPQPRAGAGARLVTHAFLLAGLSWGHGGRQHPQRDFRAGACITPTPLNPLSPEGVLQVLCTHRQR